MELFLAEEKDNKELCKLLRNISVEGSIEVLYTREPNFFHALSVQGKFNQVGACSVDGEIIGVGCRSIKPMYLNEKQADFGYLSGLRAISTHRGGVTQKIFDILTDVHKDKKVPAYISTIISENIPAFRALVTSRKSPPYFYDLGGFLTHAVNLNKRKKPIKHNKMISIVKGDQVELNEIVTFLNEEGKKKQFFPVLSADDFDSDYMRDFDIKNLYVAMKDNTIVGTIGKWDHSSFKQIVVSKYNGVFKYFRIGINIFLRAFGYKPLPERDKEFKLFYTSCICIKDNDSEIFSNLLDRLYQDNKDREYHYFLIGFHDDDPLGNVIKKYYSVKYPGRLYLVLLDEDKNYIKTLRKEMTPYLELGSL